MVSRYTRLTSLPENLYSDGAPILIVAGALLRDNKDGRVLAQLKLKNLNSSPLVACKVTLRAFDPSGTELPGIDNHAYLDLTASCGEDFGSQEAIYLPDTTTRNISVSVVEAVFENREIWRHSATEWKNLPENRQPLENYLPDFETQRQYILETGGNCQYIPQIVGNLFYCTCGAINLSSNRVCYGCGREKAVLLAALNPAELTKKKDARLEKEAEARKEQERIAEERRAEQTRLEEEQRQEKERLANEKRIADKIKKEKLKRIFTIAGSIVIVGVVITTFITQILIPNIQYKTAEELLAERDYDGAITAFTALGAYKDAPKRVADIPYTIAEDLLKDGDYSNAIKAFRSLGNYRDAPERVKEAQQLQYNQADAFASTGNYEIAISLFEDLSDFSNSPEKVKEVKYNQALFFSDSENFDSAIELFKSLGGFLDSTEKIKETEYKKANYLLKTGKYDDAILGFEALENYADSKDLLSESKYRKAYDSLQKSDYENAIPVFEELVDYKDSSELLVSAKDSYYQEGIALVNSGKYVDALAIFEGQISGYKDSEQQVLNIFNTVYTDAFNAYNSGDYSSAYDYFVTTKRNHPEIISTTIEDYILCCQIKMTHFDTSNIRLNDIYDKFTSIQDETLKNQMLSVPQIQTLSALQGGWSYAPYSSYSHMGIVGTSAKTSGIGSIPGVEYEILYSNGNYYFGSLSPYSHQYLFMYRLTNISSNSFIAVRESNNSESTVYIRRN